MKNEYNEYSLFQDVADEELRARNQGIVLANIVEDSFISGRVSQKGCMMVMGYFLSLPKKDRGKALEVYKEASEIRQLPLVEEIRND